MDYIPFYQLVFFRALITLSICFVVLKSLKIKPWGNNKKLLLMRGLAGTCGLSFYFYTIQNMPLASAVTIQYLSPLITVVLAIFLLGEKPLAKQWAYFFLAFIGVLLVKGVDTRVSSFALSMGLGGALFSALAYNFVRMLKKSEHELVVVFYFPLVTIPLITPFAVNTWVWPEPMDWLWVITMGVFTHIAQVYMTRGYQGGEASNVAIYRYTGLILAIAIGFFAFDEIVTVLSLIGMGLIVAAVLLNSRVKS